MRGMEKKVKKIERGMGGERGGGREERREGRRKGGGRGGEGSEE